MCAILVSASGPNSAETMYMYSAFTSEEEGATANILTSVDIDSGLRLHKGGGSGLPIDKTPSMMISDAGTNEIILWGDSLLYSSRGETVSELILHSMSGAVVNIAADEYFKSVATSPQGALAVMTSKSRLFYGSLGVPSLIEIISGTR